MAEWCFWHLTVKGLLVLAEIPRKGPAPCPGAVEVPSESQPSARALVRVPMAGVDLGPLGPSAPESQISHSSLFEIWVSKFANFLLFCVARHRQGDASGTWSVETVFEIMAVSAL